MLRILSFFSAFIVAALPAAACDMHTDERPAALVDYYKNGQSCLATPPLAFRFDPEIEWRFVETVNRERVAHGLDRLTIRPEMQAAARFHSLDMGVNSFFDHQAPDGRSHVERVAAFDRTLLAEGTAENLAQFGPAVCMDENQTEVPCALAPGFRPPSGGFIVDDLHRKLMASEGHRRNILDPEVTHIALGVARTETGVYVTQLFANVFGELTEPAPLIFDVEHSVGIADLAPGWRVKNLALSVGDAFVDLETGEIPTDLNGNIGLSLRAEFVEEFEEENGTRTTVTWIYPTGPMITLEPSTGS